MASASVYKRNLISTPETAINSNLYGVKRSYEKLLKSEDDQLFEYLQYKRPRSVNPVVSQKQTIPIGFPAGIEHTRMDIIRKVESPRCDGKMTSGGQVDSKMQNPKFRNQVALNVSSLHLGEPTFGQSSRLHEPSKLERENNPKLHHVDVVTDGESSSSSSDSSSDSSSSDSDSDDSSESESNSTVMHGSGAEVSLEVVISDLSTSHSALIGCLSKPVNFKPLSHSDDSESERNKFDVNQASNHLTIPTRKCPMLSDISSSELSSISDESDNETVVERKSSVETIRPHESSSQSRSGSMLNSGSSTELGRGFKIGASKSSSSEQNEHKISYHTNYVVDSKLPIKNESNLTRIFKEAGAINAELNHVRSYCNFDDNLYGSKAILQIFDEESTLGDRKMDGDSSVLDQYFSKSCQSLKTGSKITQQIKKEQTYSIPTQLKSGSAKETNFWNSNRSENFRSNYSSEMRVQSNQENHSKSDQKPSSSRMNSLASHHEKHFHSSLPPLRGNSSNSVDPCKSFLPDKRSYETEPESRDFQSDRNVATILSFMTQLPRSLSPIRSEALIQLVDKTNKTASLCSVARSNQFNYSLLFGDIEDLSGDEETYLVQLGKTNPKLSKELWRYKGRTGSKIKQRISNCPLKSNSKDPPSKNLTESNKIVSTGPCSKTASPASTDPGNRTLIPSRKAESHQAIAKRNNSCDRLTKHKVEYYLHRSNTALNNENEILIDNRFSTYPVPIPSPGEQSNSTTSELSYGGSSADQQYPLKLKLKRFGKNRWSVTTTSDEASETASLSGAGLMWSEEAPGKDLRLVGEKSNSLNGLRDDTKIAIINKIFKKHAMK